MNSYVSPFAELIKFNDELRMEDVGESGCNCHIDANSAPMNVEASTCQGVTGHASENLWNIQAPNWISPSPGA